jgi:hypothetical protein
MEDQLISYETAILAKEKGFDLRTKDNFYDLAGEFQMQYGSGKYHDDELGEEWQEEKLACKSKGYHRTIKAEYKRPTQSLLQRWLRDEHEILVNPIHSYTRGLHLTYVVSVQCVKQHYLGDFIHDISYENVLEKGLLEALKLI